MSQVIIKLVDNSLMTEFYFTKDQAAKASELFKAGKYRFGGDFIFSQEGEDACEEAFDLTNNPSRQFERDKYYGRNRSVSVGDIVEVDGVNFVCASAGWEQLA